MKNLSKLFGIIALIAVIGFSMAACGDKDDGTTWTPYPENGGDGLPPKTITGTITGNQVTFDTGDEDGDEDGMTFTKQGSGSGFDGTWTGDGGMTLVAKGGSFTVSMGGTPAFRGTYTVSGNDVTITFTEINTGSSGSNSGDSNSSSDNNGSSQPQGSIFRLTHPRSDHVGKYALLFAQNDYGDYIIGADDVTVNASGMSGKAVRISGGSVDFKMFVLMTDGRQDRYHGDDTVEATIMIFNSANVSEGDDPIAQKYYTITFSDGAATKMWDDGQDQPPDNGE